MERMDISMSVSEDKISQILSSPENLNKIAEIAKSLSGSGSAGGEVRVNNENIPTDDEEEAGAAEETRSEPEKAEIPSGVSFGSPDINGILQGLNISPAFMSTIGRAAEGFNDGERRVTLLNAIKPFAHGKNSETLDRAIWALKIARAARIIMDNH